MVTSANVKSRKSAVITARESLCEKDHENGCSHWMKILCEGPIIQQIRERGSILAQNTAYGIAFFCSVQVRFLPSPVPLCDIDYPFSAQISSLSQNIKRKSPPQERSAKFRPEDRCRVTPLFRFYAVVRATRILHTMRQPSPRRHSMTSTVY